MTEKYKIYLPKDMKARLINDAELFEFTKKDGSVNLNAFLKELLVNYFDQYRERKTRLLQTIQADLDTFVSLSKKDAQTLANRIIDTYMQEEKSSDESGTVITLTVSGRSLDVIRAIEYNLLSQTSLSQYLKNLFRSYLSISRDNRERIIFRDKFDELNSAIAANRVIIFSSSTAPDWIFSVAPYMIAASKEEQCNYLLCCDTRSGIPRSFRISRIGTIFSTSKTFVPDEDKRAQIEEAAIRSPHDVSKCVDAKVRLTKQGIHKFQVITKNRPDVLSKNDSIYCFHWPARQLEDYFKRFGEDALFLEPAECRETLRTYYRKALEAYTEASTKTHL